MAQLTKRLGNRYGTAIFELSIERGMLNENLNQAMFLRDALSDDDCKKIITHPRISSAEKISFFNQAFSEHISQDLLGFLKLTVTKNREEFIVPALSSFIDMANDFVRKTTATVISAVPLKADQLSSLAALLSKKTNKQVTIEQKIDPSVIGGLYIQVDGYVIDCTIKTRLQEVKSSMMESSIVNE